MATVTITITDVGTGISVNLESEPGFPGPAAKDQAMTNAQHLGFVALEVINKTCGIQTEEEADGSDGDSL